MDAQADLIQHIPKLRRYARALTGNAAHADDLVQDTLERALNKLQLWRSGSDMRAWLFTIMHNLFVNHVKSANSQVHQELDAAMDVPVAGEQYSQLGLRDIQSALGLLPDEQREILLLVGLEQYSYAEAADILGLPLGTVMSRLSRGRERLRQLLASEPAPELRVVK